MKELVERLKNEGRLEACEYRSLLLCEDEDVARYLAEAAREVALERFGNGIYIRGLIEIGNVCRNDCLYCGIRKSNASLRRYLLSESRILECCRMGYSLGFRTFVFQGGEMDDGSDLMVERLCQSVRKEFPDCAITLSLGEKTEECYRRWFEAGADRYLLRHETASSEHYARLHPAGMSLEHRMECLSILKDIGYQTGTGIMVGSPYQSVDDIVSDILFISGLQPEMIGLGPFIPHRDTPFAGWRPSPGRLDLTLRLISVFRLMLPDALIPATTALATIAPHGREQGILAGANVVMPNLSPAAVRSDYSLYDGKAASGAESAEGLSELTSCLGAIGYRIDTSRGDWKHYNRRT